jgi:20S proteasome alpha/beta subunit
VLIATVDRLVDLPLPCLPQSLEEVSLDVFYYSFEPWKVWADAKRMTIGIGCICERGDCVVLASDMRASYGTTPVGPNDACGKVFRLGQFNTMVCIAGRISSCHAVRSQLVHNVGKLSKLRIVSREHVIRAIDEARMRELRRVYDWTIQTNWGISLYDFARGKVPGGKLDKLLLRAGFHLLKNTPLKVELIVAGFVPSQTMFFRASQKQPLEEESSPGVYAIGSGQIPAMTQLNRRSQHVAMSLPRTLLHVHEAMIAARSSDPKGIGHPQAYIVMRKHVPQTLYLEANAPALENWRKAYRGRRNTGSLDDSKVAGIDIYQQLKTLKPIKGVQ